VYQRVRAAVRGVSPLLLYGKRSLRSPRVEGPPAAQQLAAALQASALSTPPCRCRFGWARLHRQAGENTADGRDTLPPIAGEWFAVWRTRFARATY